MFYFGLVFKIIFTIYYYFEFYFLIELIAWMQNKYPHGGQQPQHKEKEALPTNGILKQSDKNYSSDCREMKF